MFFCKFIFFKHQKQKQQSSKAIFELKICESRVDFLVNVIIILDGGVMITQLVTGTGLRCQ